MTKDVIYPEEFKEQALARRLISFEKLREHNERVIAEEKNNRTEQSDEDIKA